MIDFIGQIVLGGNLKSLCFYAQIYILCDKEYFPVGISILYILGSCKDTVILSVLEERG